MSLLEKETQGCRCFGPCYQNYPKSSRKLELENKLIGAKNEDEFQPRPNDKSGWISGGNIYIWMRYPENAGWGGAWRVGVVSGWNICWMPDRAGGERVWYPQQLLQMIYLDEFPIISRQKYPDKISGWNYPEDVGWGWKRKGVVASQLLQMDYLDEYPGIQMKYLDKISGWNFWRMPEDEEEVGGGRVL